MKKLLGNGQSFQPNKEELLNVILYLKGTFSQASLELFENNEANRNALIKTLEKPIKYMFLLAEDKNYPNFDEYISMASNLSFSQCAQFLLFYIRLAYRQGGGESFLSLWRNGSVEKIIDRMICEYSNFIDFDKFTIT